jgi:hypothetical protein
MEGRRDGGTEGRTDGYLLVGHVELGECRMTH